MLNHRNIVVLFFVITSGLLALDTKYTIHWLFYALPFVLFLTVEIYGAAFIRSGFHIKTHSTLSTSEKWIVLSFDDGPSAHTQKVLDVLEEFDAKATFFCIGKKIQGNEYILKEIHAKGHLIGNHSYAHNFLYDLKSTSSFVNDLELAGDEIERVIGKKPAFFRPPYGVTTPGIARACKKLNLEVIGWNIRSLDTQISDRQELLERIKSKLSPGSILLLHDTIHGTELAVKELLGYLKENNYKIVPLDEAIEKKAYA